MPAQPAADRAAVPPEVAADEPPPGEWPRFEVCIDGRCPIEDTLNVIAGRWKILILWWLQEGELRFSELRRCIPTITQKMLTQQLRQMEVEGLVSREVFAQVPPKVIYTLTERGQSLRPVLRSLRNRLDDPARVEGDGLTGLSVPLFPKPHHTAVRTTIAALGTRKRPFLKSWCPLRNMRIPFISRLSVMKVNPKGETPLDQKHNVRRKTFISLPFVGGLSAFAVILPQPFPW
jgi:DNA-binding HxlR family transcriptional regulator